MRAEAALHAFADVALTDWLACQSTLVLSMCFFFFSCDTGIKVGYFNFSDEEMITMRCDTHTYLCERLWAAVLVTFVWKMPGCR